MAGLARHSTPNSPSSASVLITLLRGRNRLKRKDLLFVLAGLIIGVGLGIVLIFGLDLASFPGLIDSSSDSIPPPGPKVGAQAPDFELETLNGDNLSLQDLQGKTVLLNFWATWCAPCRIEMPALEERHDRYQPDFMVVGINFDEPAEDVSAYALELGLTFPVLLDPGGEVQRQYQIRGYPTSFIIDGDGIIRVQHIGQLTESQLDEYLSQVGVEQ